MGFVRAVRVVLLAGLLALVGALLAPASADATVDGGPITLGTPFTAQVPGSGADDPDLSYRFSGQAGQRIVLRTGNPSVEFSAQLVGPDPAGTDTGFDRFNPTNGFADLGVLTSTGTWHLVLSSFGAPSTEQITLTAVADQTGALTYGTPKTLDLAAGQNGALTFNGGAGQKIAFDVTASAFTGDPWYENRVLLQLVKPDGTPSNLSFEVNGPTFWDDELPEAGTWTLRIDPVGANAGSITLTAFQPADIVKTVTPGASTAVTYPGRGVNVRLKVNATAGQRLVFGFPASDLTSPTGIARVKVRVIDPTGRERAWSGDVDHQSLLESVETVDRTGTWTVVLDPYGLTSGTQTVRIGGVADPAPQPITLGATTTIKIDPVGANPSYTFTGRAGQILVAQLDPAKLTSGGWGGVPGADAAVSIDVAGTGSLIQLRETYGELQLPEDGTYTIRVDGYADTVGSATLKLRYATTTTQPLRLGTTTTATLQAGDRAGYTFTGVVGRRFVVDVSAFTLGPVTSYAPLTVRLLAPDGGYAWTQDVQEPGLFEGPVLPVGGAWTLEFDPLGAAAGSVTFKAGMPADLTGTLTTGTPVTTTITQVGQQARYTFRGIAGRRVTIDSSATNWSAGAQFTLFKPDGTEFSSFVPPVRVGNKGATWTETGNQQLLDVTGTWTLVVDPTGRSTGSQTFTLRQIQDLTGTLKLGKAFTVDLPTRGQQARYTFTYAGQDNGSLPVRITNSTIARGVVQLRAPGGWAPSGEFGTGTSSLSFLTLQDSGTWTLVVDPLGTSTGKATIKLG